MLILLLVAGFLLTGHKPLTPLLMVLIIFLNDFLTMALTTDRMSVSPQPNPWRTRPIVIAGAVFGLLRLVFSFGVFAIGHYALRFDTPNLQSLTFATVILGSQAGMYLLRERGHCWASCPSRAVVGSTLLGLGVMAFITLAGFHVPPISSLLLAAVSGLGVIYLLGLDWFKVWILRKLSLR